jgi:hypothetical protein
VFEFIYGVKQLEVWVYRIDTFQKTPHEYVFLLAKTRAPNKIENILFGARAFLAQSVSYFYHELFSLVNNSCSFPNSRGFLHFLISS